MNAIKLLTAFTLLAPTALAFDDGDGLRNALVPVGDVDGDGHVDFAFAERPETRIDPDGARALVAHQPRVEIRSGVDGHILRSFEGPPGFGADLAAVGDLDGDGVAELIVGCGVRYRLAGVALLSPGTGDLMHTFERPAGSLNFGRGLAGGQQLVGDSTPDLVIGEENLAWIVDGRSLEPSAVLRAVAGRTVRVEVDSWERVRVSGKALETLGSTGPWMRGKLRTRFLSNVKVLPDLDGDGLGEVVLTTVDDPLLEVAGATANDADRVAQRSFAPLDEPVVSRLIYSSGREPFVFRSACWMALSGVDLDGDGFGDLVTTTVSRRVRAWSLGRRALLWERNFDGAELASEGTSLAWTSDVDGDGVRDIVFAANETVGHIDPGYVELIASATGRTARRTFPSAPGGIGGVDANVLDDHDGDGVPEVITFQPHGRILALLDGKTLEVVWEVVLVEDEAKADD